jgi:hypothetical protein
MFRVTMLGLTIATEIRTKFIDRDEQDIGLLGAHAESQQRKKR